MLIISFLINLKLFSYDLNKVLWPAVCDSLLKKDNIYKYLRLKNSKNWYVNIYKFYLVTSKRNWTHL